MVTLTSEVVAAGTRAGIFQRFYETVAALLADTAAIAEGQYVAAAEHLYIGAASAATDHHLTNAGGSKLYVLPEADGHNVKAFGATGDGVTDDLAAINLALAAARVSTGMVYFPNGTYLVSDTINMGAVDSTNYAMILRGSNSNAAIITGSVDNGGVIEMIGFSAGGQGSRGLEYLQVRNTSSTGGWCVLVQNYVGTTMFKSCQFRPSNGSGGVRGAPAEAQNANTFTGIYEACLFKTAVGNGGIGLAISGHTSVVNCDITGFDKGLICARQQNYIVGCRVEINGTGMVIGELDDGTAFASDRTVVESCSFEANDIGLHIRTMSGTVSGIGVQGSTGSPSAQSAIGVLIDASDFSMHDVKTIGTFSAAAIVVRADNIVYSNVNPTNNFSGSPVWAFEAPIQDSSFINCANLGRNINHQIFDIESRGIAKYNALSSALRPKNLSGVGVAVTEAATSVAVSFPPDRANSVAEINTVTATTGGSLAEGTYYYMATIVNEMGEGGRLAPAKEESVVITSPNNAATVTFFSAVPANCAFRVYRGTASGVYDGYYQITSAPFTDTGAAFTDIKQPPAQAATIPSAQEPDANYGVVVTPSWGTTAWVTNKATSGFTINFGTAAPANATVDWILMR